MFWDINIWISRSRLGTAFQGWEWEVLAGDFLLVSETSSCGVARMAWPPAPWEQGWWCPLGGWDHCPWHQAVLGSLGTPGNKPWDFLSLAMPPQVLLHLAWLPPHLRSRSIKSGLIPLTHTLSLHLCSFPAAPALPHYISLKKPKTPKLAFFQCVTLCLCAWI